MLNWTLDAGEGIDDHLVFITSEGEVFVYKGTDPSSATTWAMVGRWYIGSPVGKRCLSNLGGDVLVICQDGLLPLAEALQSSRVNPRVALTDKIRAAVSQAVTLYGSTFGWEVILYPQENLLFLNVPTSSTTSEQYVMHTITRSWCRFTGWNAACWELFNDQPYFGGSTVVYKAWGVQSDAGANIQADVKSAFAYFGSKQQKAFTLARPQFLSSGGVEVTMGLNLDYRDDTPQSTISGGTFSAGVWDTSLWDVGIWGGDVAPLNRWVGVRGVGFSASTRLLYNNRGFDLRWVATDYNYVPGGVL
jgi:hypothetical protein